MYHKVPPTTIGYRHDRRWRFNTSNFSRETFSHPYCVFEVDATTGEVSGNYDRLLACAIYLNMEHVYVEYV